MAPKQYMLELTARLMERAFEELGEGVILGTMPGYLQRFGAANARYVAKHYVACEPEQGTLQALAPMNHVSNVTGTEYSLPMASGQRTVKRLHDCEFRSSFDGRSEFPRAMMCMLHEAVYQGSVNGLADGYEVEVQSRILFGDPHCDFEVTSAKERPGGGTDVSLQEPRDADLLNLHFYTYVLVSFVDYLRAQLGPRAETICAEVGIAAGPLAADVLGIHDDDARTVVGRLLTAGRRSLEDRDDGVFVTECPQATGIMEAASTKEACQAACELCRGTLQGATAALGARIVRESSLTTGADGCMFRLEKDA